MIESFFVLDATSSWDLELAIAPLRKVRRISRRKGTRLSHNLNLAGDRTTLQDCAIGNLVV